MRKQNYAVFDEHIPTGTDAAHAVFTSAELNSRIGHFDQLAIQVVLDDVKGGPIGGFDLYIEHSADGRNFVVTKENIPNPPVAGNGDVKITAPLATNGANVAWGANNGSTPFLGLVRLRMFFSNATTSAHVRVHVTQRDQG